MAVKKVALCSFLVVLLVSGTAHAASLSDFVKAVKSKPTASPAAPRYTNIFEAAQQGTAEDVAQTVQTGADVNTRDVDGNTPLMYAAAQNPSAAVVEALIQAGANVNAQSNDRVTALMWAASAGIDNSDVIKALIRYGADIRSIGVIAVYFPKK